MCVGVGVCVCVCVYVCVYVYGRFEQARVYQGE